MTAPTESFVTSLQPLDFRGLNVSPESLDNEDDGVLAILPDDQVVRLVEWTCILVGHGGATVGGTSANENGAHWLCSPKER